MSIFLEIKSNSRSAYLYEVEGMPGVNNKWELKVGDDSRED